MTKKKTTKNKGGRPTRYKAEYAEQGRKLCLLKYTDKQLADFFGVALSTISKWKIDHKEFSESLRAGKDMADGYSVDGLQRRAEGYTITIMKPMSVNLGAGLGSEIQQVETQVHIPPDPGAAKILLAARQPQLFTERKEVELSGKVELTAEQRKARLAELLAKRGE